MSLHVRLESIDEFHTIMAALRYYQRRGMGEPLNRPDWLHEIACPDMDVTSLNDKGIDELCQRINTEAVPPLAPAKWSIAYAPVRDGCMINVYFGGPFYTEEEAMAWARSSEYHVAGRDAEFNITEDYVYLIDPEHKRRELNMVDFGV